MKQLKLQTEPIMTALAWVASVMFILQAVYFYRGDWMLSMAWSISAAFVLAIFPFVAYPKIGSRFLLLASCWMMFTMLAGPGFYRAITGKATYPWSWWFLFILFAVCLLAATVLICTEAIRLQKQQEKQEVHSTA
jgi:hypothetical protein